MSSSAPGYRKPTHQYGQSLPGDSSAPQVGEPLSVGETMENPATWGRAEHVVAEAIRKSEENRQRPPGQRVIGLSLVRQITDALRDEGLLTATPDSDGPGR